MIKIRRALLSVSDKNKITDLAIALKQYDCEIISTGGTKKTLEEADIPVTEISNITGNPEAFGGRMKTISFAIESALLFDRTKDAEEAEKLGILPIDLVVCNLYPFEQKKTAGAEEDELIENIDIGGPTMIRAAAKNFRYVLVLTNPNDYQEVIDELHQNNGSISLETRKKMMREAFHYTADYDAFISQTMDELDGKISFRFHFSDAKELRYGENPHQKAFFLKNKTAQNSLYDLHFLHGKELSYNNILDLQSAIEAVQMLSQPACAIAKHNNTCGFASAKSKENLLEFAWQGDSISAFGSIIAFNFPIQKEDVTFLQLDNPDKSQRKFVEVIVAPKIEQEALSYLQFHKNLRVIEFPVQKTSEKFDFRFLENSLLVQSKDDTLFEDLRIVTEKTIAIDEKIELIEFGIHTVKHLKSNAIAIVRETKNGIYQLIGMGAGQPNRLNSTKLAIEKAKENLRKDFSENEIKEELGKTILVSDAFFPFSDNIELAEKEGIKIIVQPGGSISDKKMIKTCNDLGICMIFTGSRHFKH
jgi:phosphoribosylaminoimidazolecarboxamide formyltransferase/IMP cyclohydrolase